MMADSHPDMDGLSLDDLRVVHVAWTAGSFTAAADALGVGQATVSRRVAAVEDQLGEVLFDRHRTGLEPTPALHALRPHLEALTAAADGALRAVEGLETEPAGDVRIAAPPGVCVDLFPELAARLSRTHPDIRLDVLADIRTRDMDRREADIAVRFVPTTRGDLLARRLLTLPGGLYATPELVARLPPEATLDDVPLVGWSEELSDIPMARELHGLSSRPLALRTNNYLVLRAAVCAGIGASVLGQTEAEAFGLVPVPCASAVRGEAPLYLVVHRALRRVPRVSVVIDHIDALATEMAVRLAEGPVSRSSP